MRLSLALLVALSLSLAACKKAGPSPEYAQARDKWSALVKASAFSAAEEPGADEVLALLARVPADSSDAPFAAELKTEIDKGRKEAADRRADATKEQEAMEKARQAALAAMASSPVVPAASADSAPSAAPAADAQAAPDAGEKDDGQPKRGMDASTFKSKFARCFEYKNDAMVGGTGGGQVWGLKDLSICRQLHSNFTANSVLLWDGKVDIRSTAELAPKKYKLVDGKLVPEEEATK